MKVERKQEFSPVTITLESQEEVDKMFALLVFAPVNERLDIHWWEKLESYKTFNYVDYFTIIDDLYKGK